MDKAVKYRECFQALLTQYSQRYLSDDETEVQLVFDLERDHYQWMDVGWKQFDRIYRCVMHFDIKDGKIWLQQNLTEHNPAEDLVKMGVLREDIVLGLQAPFKRQYTGYGVA